MKTIWWLPWLFLGLLLGGLYNWFQPAKVVARTLIYFPGVEPLAYARLTQALKVDPGQVRAGQGQGVGLEPGLSGSGEIPRLACLILQSRAAAQAVLLQGGYSLKVSRWRGDPVELLLKRLKVVLREPATVVVELSSNDANQARGQLQQFLNYYSDFVAKNSLTRVEKARKDVETRLSALVKRLSKLEDELRQSARLDLRRLGDSTIKADPKVMQEVWLRRAEEEGSSRQLLDRLQEIRGKHKTDAAAAWMAEWSKERSKVINPWLRAPVRSQDVLKQAKLERDYDEALLQYRSLILQQSFLLTWEKLENTGFETVDPIYVSPQSRPWLGALLIGGLLGMVTGYLWRLGRR